MDGRHLERGQFDIGEGDAIRGYRAVDEFVDQEKVPDQEGVLH